jgi:uncharacterized protein YdeI (YjbR/CyaY-like superfamily)
MLPAGLAEIEAAKVDGRWDAAYESQRNAGMPPDLAAALAQNERAKRAFDQRNKSGQYAIILPILTAATASSRAIRVQRAITTLKAGNQV